MPAMRSGFGSERSMLRSVVLGVVSAVAYLAPGCGSDMSDGPRSGKTVGMGGGSGSLGGSATSSSGSGQGGTTGGTGGVDDAGADGGATDGGVDAAPNDARGAGDANDSGLVDLKMMTFNIRYANPADGVNAWPNRRNLVYQVIRDQNLDTVGLQEALVAQVHDLEAALPEFHRIGVGRDDGVNAGEFSAILYRASRFDVESSGTFWFSDTPEVPGSSSWGNASIRICTWGRFVEHGTGRAFYQFNVHLDNVSEPANEKSVQLLMARVVQRQFPTDPFIVTGDFNSSESQPPVRYMTGAAPIATMANPIPTVDSFRQLYPNATGIGTFHNFVGGTGGDKIDFIFMGPGERAVAAEIIHTQQNGLYPSDHYPVTATIDILGWN